MRVDPGEVELSRNEEEHGTHGREAGVAARLALGGLEETVQGFDEAVGLAGLGPGNDAVEVKADHSGDLLHRLDLGAQHVGGPLLEQTGDDADLLAVEDFAQVLAIEPGAGGSPARRLGDQGIEVDAAGGRKAVAVLEQSPTHALEGRIGFLFNAAHLIDGGRGMGDDMKFVESDARPRQMFADPFDEGRRHVDAHRLNLLGGSVMRLQVFGKAPDGLGLFALGHEHDLAFGDISSEGQIVMAAPGGGFIDRHRGDGGQIGFGQGKIDITRANGMHTMPRHVHQLGNCGKRHLLGHGQDQGLEQKSEAGELAEPLRLDLRHAPVGQIHPRRPDLQEAFVLEEVEMPQPLDPGVMDRMQVGGIRMLEAATRDEIDRDGQRLPGGIEIHALNVPGRLDT